MPSARPRFIFAAMSPYSWLAAERIGELLPRASWQPVFAGGMFKACGRVSWGLTEDRAQESAEVERRARSRGLGEVRWPDPWPTNDLLIARAMIYVQQHANGAAAAGRSTADAGRGNGLLERFALGAMRLAFREGADLGELDSVLEAARRAGIEQSALQAALSAPEIKLELRRATDEAVALGVFGIPTVLVGELRFWGDDRLADAAAAASG
jgi:2-hydroxychromene-2-carboxylate isomerase